jgi:hypothetical protein
MAVFNVSGAAQFQAALSQAIGGDKILLAPGDYESVTISGRKFSSNVIIQSASWTDRAHFDDLTVTNSKNILFNGLDLGRGRVASDSEFGHINHVRWSTNIRFNDTRIHGDQLGTSADDLIGLSIYDSYSVKVTNSDFGDLVRGVYVLRSNDTAVTGNDFHNIRMDGVAAASATSILIHDNLFRNFEPVGDDHADAIQFWNSGQAKGSSNISIKNNVIWFPEDYAGADQGVQGVWIADPGSLGYRNVTIQNNLIYANDRWNGVSVYGGNGVQVLNNTLLSRTDDSKFLWVRVEDSRSVAVRGNVTEDQYVRGTSGLTQSGNLDLSDSPALRSLFADLDAPESIYDLITPGVGYQPTANLLATVPLGKLQGAQALRSAPVLEDLVELSTPETVVDALPEMNSALPTHWFFDSYIALP